MAHKKAPSIYGWRGVLKDIGIEMADKNYNDISDNEVRIIGGGRKKYFCKAFAANCICFEDTGLCSSGDCIHAESNIPSSNEMLRLQLLQMRRTQLDMANMSEFSNRNIPHYKPKSR